MKAPRLSDHPRRQRCSEHLATVIQHEFENTDAGTYEVAS